jgi:HSP20 family protein
MTDFGTKRQREDQSSNLTASERTEGRAGQSQGVERYQQGRYQQGRYQPSVFSVSPGEFFTMSPITLMRRFTEDIDRAFGFGSGLGSGFGSGLQRGQGSQQEFNWVPPVEVRQSGNNLVIHADLPGLNENDVKVEATEDGLAIHGERRQEQTSEEGGWRHSERVYGRFYRLIPLPENAKIEETKANFRNGVLEVVVPVTQSEKRNRQIPVGTSNQSLISEPGTFSEGRARTATSGR